MISYDLRTVMSGFGRKVNENLRVDFVSEKIVKLKEIVTFKWRLYAGCTRLSQSGDRVTNIVSHVSVK